MNIGYILSELRQQHKMSQKELAEKLGVSQAYVGQWENGTRTIPTEKVVELSEIYGVSTDYILNRPMKGAKGIDLKELLRNQNSMSYNGKELSEHDINTLSRVIGAYLEGDED